MHPAHSSSPQAAKSPAARTNLTPTFWPVANPTTGPRLFTHSPYLTTGNIIASECLDAVEFEALGGVDGQRTSQGPPITSGPHRSGSSFNASSNSGNQLHTPHGYSNSKKNVCRHFINGNCNRGSSCRFYHPGPIHCVITPTRPRTPTQRPLTPLADLAQHSSASATQSPAHSPYIKPTSALLFSSPRQSLKLNSGGVSARSNPESFASPPTSPSTSVSAQRSTAFVESPAHVVTTAPALSSPSFGPQFSLGSSLGARARCWSDANLLPSLQLPEYLSNGIDDGTAEACSSATGADMGPPSRPHSPSSPGPYRLPVYCAGVQLGASSNSGRGERTAALASLHHHKVPGCSFPAASSKTVTSPRPGSVTRNNPYAYSPTRVRPQLSQPMSPLKQAPNGPE
ncbi:hypothetical protein LMXM_28_1405 [Leishmania mexicana MHOM/GT/2001/U1103]|uniref:C3H1-type domain-containing protein n=1 Tax=Leishmania mexicana (strain MHOM/GT/2001/U1103) TaxID=929439 RepID=E9AZW0_LEIMU|nr:hypothetical protein LMXM_28_1405 [Leishmania mexicana MHOM/GT/2001/U1103]CBZ28511.1 hypothetical protein LMXM_28_1405 [Leishmania mexicana MHOM/GT/2001/U1103]